MTASITSSSSTEIVSTTTRVRGAMLETWRVVSTPVSPGIFRSMTTTSGASSPTRRRASRPLSASPTTCRPWPSSRLLRPRAEEIVVVDEQHAQLLELLPGAPILGG